MAESTALFTDRYELTMIDAAMREGRAERRCVFEVFSRRLHAGRRYGVFAGIGRLIDAIESFRFDDEIVSWLSSEKVVSTEALEYLSTYRFSGDIRGYREGELFFPGSPVLEVEGTFAEAVILETIVLSILNYDSAVATAASRMATAADGKPLIEMGSRRTSEGSGVAAARAAFIAGFAATSNLEAGRTWGIPTRGTSAHSFTLLHDSEEAAFRAQVEAFGTDTTLLIDTFDIPSAVETAIRVAGPSLGAVRIDSGDLPSLVRSVRAQLDSLGATGTKIVVTNDLNENTIASLRGAPVDVFGVGTAVVTGSGAPAAGMVYKLVEHQDAAGNWVAVSKRSPEKQNPAGRKVAHRRLVDGIATEEVVDLGPKDSTDGSGRPLIHDVITNGVIRNEYRGGTGVTRARDHHAIALAELPAAGRRLSPGDPAIPTVFC
jgi:nicotinate phosphoribosyltransferase